MCKRCSYRKHGEHYVSLYGDRTIFCGINGNESACRDLKAAFHERLKCGGLEDLNCKVKLYIAQKKRELMKGDICDGVRLASGPLTIVGSILGSALGLCSPDCALVGFCCGFLWTYAVVGTEQDLQLKGRSSGDISYRLKIALRKAKYLKVYLRKIECAEACVDIHED